MASQVKGVFYYAYVIIDIFDRYSSLGFVTPEQIRNGKALEIFRKRNKVMEQAKMENPECWGSRETIQWKPRNEVILNPDKRG